jgi:predicted XRE-type DNA-binding protein
MIESSGNVFADLEVAEPDEAVVKVELAHAIVTLVVARQMAETQAAELFGIDQPKLSALMRGRLSGFSVDRLLCFLLALDRDVEIVVTPKKEARPPSERRRRGVTLPLAASNCASKRLINPAWRGGDRCRWCNLTLGVGQGAPAILLAVLRQTANCGFARWKPELASSHRQHWLRSRRRAAPSPGLLRRSLRIPVSGHQ